MMRKIKLNANEKTYWAIHNTIVSMTPMEACVLNLHSALYEAGKKLNQSDNQP